MSLPGRFRRYFRYPWRTEGAIAAEVDEEIALHLEARVEDLVAEGMDPETAATRAGVEFGDVTATRRALREADRRLEQRRSARLRVDGIVQDLRFAARYLFRHSRSSILAILVVGTAIGASTAIFSVVQAVLLQPLPYPAADRLMVFYQDHQGRGGPPEENFNLPDFADLRARTRSFAAVAAVIPSDAALTGQGSAERVTAPMVSHDYFDVFGVRPALGRFFRPTEETSQGEPLVVLSSRLWNERFGGDPEMLGRSIVLDGSAYTVVGVAEPGFRPPEGDTDLWLPLQSDPTGRSWRFYIVRVFGRLRLDAGAEEARADLEAIGAGIAADHPDRSSGIRLRAEALHDRVVGSARSALWVVFGASGFVILLMCANVAALLLGRAVVRERAFSIRAALGAGRWRLARQLVAESLLLAFAGGLFGILLARAGVRALQLLAPAGLPRVDEISLDPFVLAFALALVTATGTLCGLAPALRVARTGHGPVLNARGSANEVGGIRRTDRFGALVVVQMAVAVILLIGAGLLANSFMRTVRVDPGFDARNVLTAELQPPSNRYREPAQINWFYADLAERLEGSPAIRSVGSVTVGPLGAGSREVAFRIEGGPARVEEQPRAHYRFASAGYVETMGIAVQAGRSFDKADRLGSPPVVLINETLARRVWPGESPLGKRISPEWAQGDWSTVVGVIADIRQQGLTRDPLPELYAPAAQMPTAARSRTLVVRVEGSPQSAARMVRDAVWEIDPDLPVDGIFSLERRMAERLAMPTIVLSLVSLFGAVSLAWAVLGLFGLLSASVAARAREIAIRMAVGARPRNVLGAVVGRAVRLIAAGGVLGVLGAIALTRWMRALLYQVTPTDPITFGGAVAILISVALVAAYIPARRAALVNPMVGLRAD